MLNILYAVGCGCVTGMWWRFAGAASQEQLLEGRDRQAFVEFIEKSLEEARDSALQNAKDDQEREQLSRSFDFFMEEDLANVLYDAILAVSGTGPVKSLATLGTVAIVLLVLLLVASVMMLMRVPISRLLCLMACAGLIVVTVMAAVEFAKVGTTAGEAMVPAIEDLAEQGGAEVDPSVDAEIQDIPEKMRMASSVISIIYAFFAAAWPLLALLLIAFSRGIKESLGLEPPAVAAGEF
jgi:hypothetical protein